MRSFIFLSFCLVVRATVIQNGLPGSEGSQEINKVIGPVKYLSKRDPSTSKRIADFGRKYGITLRDNEEVVTNEANFVYPCGCENTKFDYECIRKFFAKNSDCTPVRGRVPDPLVLPQYRAFFPSVNMTGSYANISFEGLSKARVCTFYYNKKTGKLVFAIKIPVISVDVSETIFTYRRPCRENIDKSGSTKVVYRSLIFTAIIPSVAPFGKLRLAFADINAYIGDANPKVTADPSLTDSTNPVVVAQSESLFESLPLIEKEVFLFQSQLLTAIFIQKNVCNFGLELYAL